MNKPLKPSSPRRAIETELRQLNKATNKMAADFIRAEKRWKREADKETKLLSKLIEATKANYVKRRNAAARATIRAQAAAKRRAATLTARLATFA